MEEIDEDGRSPSNKLNIIDGFIEKLILFIIPLVILW
jgi:hypothetical protein